MTQPQYDFSAMRDWVNQKRESGELPDWAGKQADAGPRDAIRDEFQGTHDIAGAAEALVEDGQIDYTQATSQEIADAIDEAGLPKNVNQIANPTRVIRDAFMGWGNESWPYVTQGNCYEFIHLAGQFSSDDPTAFSSNWGNRIADVLEPDSVEVWDGSSPIPRGKVVIGIASASWGGQGRDGTYHFGISLGDGKVANNRGKGASIEQLADVFGGFFTVYARKGGKVIYGDYRHFAPRQEIPTASSEDRIFHNPTDAAQRRMLAKKAAVPAGVATAALIGVLFSFGTSDDPGIPVASPAASPDAVASTSPAPVASPSPMPSFEPTPVAEPDPRVQDAASVLHPFFPGEPLDVNRDVFGLETPLVWRFDARNDLVYSRSTVTAGRSDPAADLIAFGAWASDPDPATFDALLGNTEYPCGMDDGTTIVVCPSSTSLPDEPLTLVALELDGPVRDATGQAVYAFVADTDGDPSNDWQPQGGFDWDYFQGTDTWVQLEGDPVARSWSLRVSRVDASQTIQEVELPVRAVIRGSAVVFVVPTSTVPTGSPFRVSSFLHDGTFAPEVSGGDVPGSDPTGDLLAPG